jgi:hypothetical protein
MDYITCESRKNAPKINVLICEKKCQEAKTCKAYLNYLQIQSVSAALNRTPSEREDLPAADQLPENSSPLSVGK